MSASQNIMTSCEINLWSDRISHHKDGSINNRDWGYTTINFDINIDKSVDFSKAVYNSVRGLAPSISLITIAQGTEYLSELKIIMLKK